MRCVNIVRLRESAIVLTMRRYNLDVLEQEIQKVVSAVNEDWDTAMRFEASHHKPHQFRFQGIIKYTNCCGFQGIVKYPGSRITPQSAGEMNIHATHAGLFLEKVM